MTAAQNICWKWVSMFDLHTWINYAVVVVVVVIAVTFYYLVCTLLFPFSFYFAALFFMAVAVVIQHTVESFWRNISQNW